MVVEMIISMGMTMDSGEGDDDVSCLGFIEADNVVVVVIVVYGGDGGDDGDGRNDDEDGDDNG